MVDLTGNKLAIALGFVLSLVLAIGLTPALALDELGQFELEGNVAVDTPPADDWEVLDDGTGDPNNDDEALESVFVFDDGADGIDDAQEINYLGGGSKDDLQISFWEWDTSPVPNKNDIMTAGAAYYIYIGPEICPEGFPSGHPLCTVSGDPIIYFFLDRFDGGTGDADVGFWFFSGVHGLVPSASDPTKGTFSNPTHGMGDLLVLSEFTIGGGVSTVKVFEWVGDANGSETSMVQPPAGTGDGPLQLRFTGQDCETAPEGDPACATVNKENDGIVTPTWNYFDKEGDDFYDLAALFEGGINIRALNLDIGCGGTFLANTRASQSTDARLHDFALGDFSLCGIAVDKSGDTLSKVGDDVTYTITITNTKALTLYKDDISDTVFGDLVIDGVDQADPNAWTSFNFATAAPCGESLAPGDSCTIEVTYTVQAGDPDPLDNTVTVHYNNKDDFSGTDVSASDDHSVNLFQPSITLTKTGDTLSKAGDDVTYTIEVCNTSSDDTPPLMLDSVTDDVIGDISGYFNATLSFGQCESRDIPYTVQEGDADPLVNTATAHYHPAGFENDISASDDHSINLFQPAIGAAKTGDTLSKVGDDVNYTITLSNNSSADTPALTCTAVDSLLGEVFSGVLPLGDTVIDNLSRTVLESDSDPLVNTVTLTCSPDGFPNVLEASASHSVNLFQPEVAVDKTGDTLSKVGDDVNYTITLSNNSSADTPDMECTAEDTLFGTIFDGVLPLGDTVINRTRMVLDTDSDPLVNTVTLTCSPTGFPNVLEASDDHSVNLFQPAIAAAKTGDELSKVGDDVNYAITLSNNSSADTPSMICTATDSLLGEVFNGALPLGDTVINTSRTVQEGDADPLVNTVTLTCSPDGFPNVLEASASHSTNLFQPAIAAAKTGDTYSKAGDDVNYTITLSNNSSADTPSMTCTAVDSLLGTVFDATLPLGDTVLNLARTTLAGDPDPLVNTVTLTCSPDGFPNVLEASASQTVDLLHPSFIVTKECASPEPIPSTESADFTITFSNTGDADLVFQSTECGTIAVATGASLTCTYTVPGPLSPPSVENTDSGTVTLAALYNLSNTYSYSATDSCEVFTPLNGCTPGFWQGGAGSQLWDQVNDPQWVYGGTNPYIHTTLFNDFFNVVTDPRLNGLTMYALVSSGGTSDSARRAARDMVAAYLNESAFPADFPAASLADLVTMWYNAVSGGDAALDAFHVIVGGWNNPEPPGFCPLP